MHFGCGKAAGTRMHPRPLSSKHLHPSLHFTQNLFSNPSPLHQAKALPRRAIGTCHCDGQSMCICQDLCETSSSRSTTRWAASRPGRVGELGRKACAGGTSSYDRVRIPHDGQGSPPTYGNWKEAKFWISWLWWMDARTVRYAAGLLKSRRVLQHGSLTAKHIPSPWRKLPPFLASRSLG